MLEGFLRLLNKVNFHVSVLKSVALILPDNYCSTEIYAPYNAEFLMYDNQRRNNNTFIFQHLPIFYEYIAAFPDFAENSQCNLPFCC